MKKQQQITTQKKPMYKNYDYLGEKRQTDLNAQPQRSNEILEHERVETNKASTKIGFYLSVGALATVIAILCILLLWSLDNSKVLEIKNNPIPVRPTRIDSDQYIILRYDYCKNTNAEGTVESQLVSKTSVLPLPTVKDRTQAMCHEFDAPYPVPGQTSPETYHYHFKACYQLNPIKQSCTEWDSQEFTIEGPEPKKEIKITFNKE